MEETLVRFYLFFFCDFFLIIFGIYFTELKIKQASKGNLSDGIGNEYETWLRSKQQIKPDDQIDLTEAELNEDVMKILDTENNNVPKNHVIFDFKQGAYVPVSVFDIIKRQNGFWYIFCVFRSYLHRILLHYLILKEVPYTLKARKLKNRLKNLELVGIGRNR